MRCCVYQSGVSTFPAAQRRPNSCRRRFCCVSDTKIKQYLKKNEKQAGAGGLRRLVHRLLSLSFKRLRTRCKCADMYNGMHARLLNVNLELRVTPQGSPGWCLNWFGFSFLLQQKAKEWFVFHLYCSFFCKQTPKSTSCSIEERSSPKGGGAGEVSHSFLLKRNRATKVTFRFSSSLFITFAGIFKADNFGQHFPGGPEAAESLLDRGQHGTTKTAHGFSLLLGWFFAKMGDLNPRFYDPGIMINWN